MANLDRNCEVPFLPCFFCLPVVLGWHSQELAELQMCFTPLRAPKVRHGEGRVQAERTQNDVAALRSRDGTEKTVAELGHAHTDTERGAGQITGDELLDRGQLRLRPPLLWSARSQAEHKRQDHDGGC